MDYLHRSLANEGPGSKTSRAARIGESGRLFFSGRGDSTAQAKAICERCPVKSECLDFAIDTGQAFGIWGGKSTKERNRLRHSRRRHRATA